MLEYEACDTNVKVSRIRSEGNWIGSCKFWCGQRATDVSHEFMKSLSHD